MNRKIRRIYIIGSVASGKTTLAQLLSQQLGIPHFELDNVVWERRPGGDVKRRDDIRDELFETIILQEKWIIEDVLRPCFEKGLAKADLLILLDTPQRKRGFMAIGRWFRQCFRIERTNYQPTVGMLKSMLRWSGDFECNKKDFMKRLEPYYHKLVVLKDPSEIDTLFDSL